MSSSGAVILGDIAGKVAMLEMECAKCDRYGRYRVDRLIEQHGAKLGLPYLREMLAADCPRQRSMTGAGRISSMRREGKRDLPGAAGRLLLSATIFFWLLSPIPG